MDLSDTATEHHPHLRAVLNTILQAVVWVAHIIPHPKSRRCRREGATCCVLSLTALREGRGLKAVLAILSECSGRKLQAPSRNQPLVLRILVWLGLGVTCGIMVSGGCAPQKGDVPCTPQIVTTCGNNG